MKSPPVLFVVGATHHTTPLELRERLALAAEHLPQVRQELAGLPGVRELAVLNTCNRVEFYGVAESAETVRSLRGAFCRRQGLSETEFERIQLQQLGGAAVRHLVEVAAGLDSQMIGENEIFGQIKEAYADAQAAGTVGPVLNRLFQKGFQAAKYVRSHTGVTTGQVSIANVAVELAGSIFGDLNRARVLLLGAGDIGEKTAKAFQSRGASQLTVANRTLERAMEFARTFDATALPFENVQHHFARFDVLVCATAAPHAVVTDDAVQAAMKQRPSQPLFLIDLALPRNVEPAVARRENVYLYNLDDLAKIAEENRAAREAEVLKARAIVAERSESLWKQVEAFCRA